ncbi:MAG: sugar transferase [Planctomycetota bacterium]
MTQATTTQVRDIPVRPEVVTRSSSTAAWLPRLRRRRDEVSASAEPWGKRVFEVSAVVLTMPLWLPVLGLLMLAVRLDSAGPACFTQQRYGRDGKVFTLWKLRSMVGDADEALPELLASCETRSAEWDTHAKLRRDPRLTRLGGWLRRSSLDELPQLFNVLRGEMSLVGPRPIPVEERERYGRAFSTYGQVRPGLTGLWQVSGRNELEYAQRIALDRRYVRSRSWLMEFGIMRRTLWAVWSGRGAY